jgi:hypothetical protein
VTLEAYLGFRSSAVTSDELRHRLWSLAHFHGAMLAMLNLIYARFADRESVPNRALASRALIAGSTLMPLGFFFGGASHPEGDPGIAIFLVPLGAVAILVAVAMQTVAAWRR